MIKKKVKVGSNFRKSIESTIKVIAEEKNINIHFGDSKSKNTSDIVLPTIHEYSDFSNLKKIDGAGGDDNC